MSVPPDAPRIWDRFLTPGDRAWVNRRAKRPIGFGRRPALILIDLYRGGFGDRPEPIDISMRDWPWSCGLTGWNALPHIVHLMTAVRSAGLPVIHSTMRDAGDGLPGWMDALHGRQGSLAGSGLDPDQARRAQTIIDECAPLPGEPLIAKAGPSAFWGTPLIGHLTLLGIDTLIVAGMATSGCVRATVVDAAAHRLRVIVPERCVFDRLEASHAMTLFDIEQKYGDVVPLETVLRQLKPD